MKKIRKPIWNQVSGRPFDQKEWDRKAEAYRAKLKEDDGIVFVNVVYTCRICGEWFYFDEPCSHSDEQRQANIEQFLRDDIEDSIEEFERKIWNIAERLTHVTHDFHPCPMDNRKHDWEPKVAGWLRCKKCFDITEDN